MSKFNEPWRVDHEGVCDANDDMACVIHPSDDYYHHCDEKCRLSLKQEEAYRDRMIACVNAMAGIEDPVVFMRELRKAFSYLGRAECDIDLLPVTRDYLLQHLRAASEAAGGFEEYT